jgi:hypothetical protein
MQTDFLPNLGLRELYPVLVILVDIEKELLVLRKQWQSSRYATKVFVISEKLKYLERASENKNVRLFRREK